MYKLWEDPLLLFKAVLIGMVVLTLIAIAALLQLVFG